MKYPIFIKIKLFCCMTSTIPIPYVTSHFSSPETVTVMVKAPHFFKIIFADSLRDGKLVSIVQLYRSVCITHIYMFVHFILLYCIL